MTHPSKRKGNGFEREVVTILRAFGWEAERAWGSNGASIGEAQDVDVKATPKHGPTLRVQCKRRATVSKDLRVPDSCDCTVLRADGQPAYVLFRLRDVAERRVRVVSPDVLTMQLAAHELRALLASAEYNDDPTMRAGLLHNFADRLEAAV